MSDFSYSISDPTELHGALIDAHSQANDMRYRALCDHNETLIHQHFPAWMVIPYNIKDDEHAVQVYSSAMVNIAVHFAMKGDSRLMDLLNGIGDDPSEKWDQAFIEFEEVMKKFDFAAARDLLTDVAEEMRQYSGPAIDYRIPYVHERLAWLFFLSGDMESAELYGRAALMGFKKTQNVEGILTVTRRLADIFKASGEWEKSKEWIIRFTNILLQNGRKENAEAVRRLHGIEPLDQQIPLSASED